MKITTDNIRVNNEDWPLATQVDFNAYNTESGSLDVAGKTYTSHKRVGLDAMIYGITTMLSHCTGDADNPTEIRSDESVELKFTADEGYELPDSVSVLNASYDWDKLEGTLELHDASGDVEVTVNAVEEFVPTAELVYTLSSDGTYYIVGTGENDIEVIRANNEKDVSGQFTDGSGLNSSWTGGEVHIPAFHNGLPVKGINSSAFNEIKNITKMIIQDEQMTTIGRRFMRCSNSIETTLTDVVLPTTLTSLGGVPFQYRGGLVNCNLGDTNAQIYGGYWFNACTSLTSITIPSGVTSIGTYAFYNCNNLTSITFEENSQLKFIDEKAFQHCSKLSSITIPSIVRDIGNHAFEHCSILFTFNFDGTISRWNAVVKGIGWKEFAPFTVVHCTDGDVNV